MIKYLTGMWKVAYLHMNNGDANKCEHFLRFCLDIPLKDCTLYTVCNNIMLFFSDIQKREVNTRGV